MADRDQNGKLLISSAEDLLNQIERAKRFAAAMTNDTERHRFEAMVFDLQRELASVQIHGFLSDQQDDGHHDA